MKRILLLAVVAATAFAGGYLTARSRFLDSAQESETCTLEVAKKWAQVDPDLGENLMAGNGLEEVLASAKAEYAKAPSRERRTEIDLITEKFIAHLKEKELFFQRQFLNSRSEERYGGLIRYWIRTCLDNANHPSVEL